MRKPGNNIMKKIFLFFLILNFNCFAADYKSTNFENIHERSIPGFNQAQNNPTIISPYNMQNYDQQLKKLYQTKLTPNITDIKIRVEIASHYFLGKPYFLGALGEGSDATFDQNPLYRTDKFDCTTFDETVLALTEAKNLEQFKQVIKKIRYQHGQVSFLNRNHFTSVDWNSNNQRNGYIKDITDQFAVRPKVAIALIDKPNWYRNLAADNIKLLKPVSSQQAAELLNQLHANSQQVSKVISRIKYLPLSELFSESTHQIIANQKVFDQIPSGSIIEIVRANWDLTRQIGTHLNVEHMGLAIRTPNGLMFREASSRLKKVTDVSLVNYLGKYYQQINNPDAFGIHIESINNT